VSKKKRVAVYSIFRNEPPLKVAHYFKQLRAMKIASKYDIHAFLVEGDSENNTLEMLRNHADSETYVTILKHDTGLPQFPYLRFRK